METIKVFQGTPQEVENSMNKYIEELNQYGFKIETITVNPGSYPYVVGTVVYI